MLRVGPGQCWEMLRILLGPARRLHLSKLLQRLVAEHRKAGAKEEASTGHITSEAWGWGGGGGNIQSIPSGHIPRPLVITHILSPDMKNLPGSLSSMEYGEAL